MFDDKSILITGGTGSFGKHFTKTILERYKHLHNKTLGGIDSFCLAYVDGWLDHIQSYIDGYRTGKIYFSKEELKPETISFIRKKTANIYQEGRSLEEIINTRKMLK